MKKYGSLLEKLVMDKKLNQTQQYRNELELRIWAIPRSGSHAIMNWIASMVEEPVYLFDNFNLYEDPLRTRYPTKDTVLKHDPSLEKIYVHLPFMRDWPEEKIQPFRLKTKKCIIYRSEVNHCVGHFSFWNLKTRKKNSNGYIGTSRYQYDVLILRDIRNWLASLIVFRTDWLNEEKIDKYFKYWKYILDEGMLKTDYLSYNKLFIKYGQWFNYEDYRRSISESLNLKYSDRMLNRLSMAGISKGHTNTGSSFSGVTYKNKAQDMKVMERAKFLSGKNLELYQSSIKAHSEMVGLSDTIFT